MSLILLLTTIIRYLYINIVCPLNWEIYNHLPRVNSIQSVIISFTTTPDRINDIKYTISSIINQSVRVDGIHLYLPYISSKGVRYRIPLWLKKLERNFEQFKIIRCDKDWGPSTKLIPALIDSKNEDDIIIYIDCDMIYYKCMIETLINYTNRFPNYAICNAGTTLKHRKYISKHRVDILEGFSGVLVKPRFFNIERMINVEKYPKELFYVDDVYISGMLSENMCPRISTDCRFYSIPYFKEFVVGFILRRNETSLSSSANKTNHNFDVGVSCFKWN